MHVVSLCILYSTYIHSVISVWLLHQHTFMYVLFFYFYTDHKCCRCVCILGIIKNNFNKIAVNDSWCTYSTLETMRERSHELQNYNAHTHTYI
jgi:hypothetical protein